MTKTTNYQLNQWDAADPIRREDFNADNAKIDAALAAIRSEAAGEAAAAQATGDRGLGVLKKLAGDVCRLAYQQDGKGTYTGWREGIAFDGLNADHQVESTSGAVVLEPANGRIRLAVDGWSGGTVARPVSSTTVPILETVEFLTEAWSPAGLATLNSVTFSGYMNDTGTNVIVHVELMQDGNALSATETIKLPLSKSTLTLTFSTAVSVEPSKKYQLKLVIENPAASTKAILISSDFTVTATAVRYTMGSFAAAPFALSGSEIVSWVQYSEPGVVTMEMLSGGTWTAMELAQESDSKTPEGTACKERTFRLTLPEETDSVQFRFNLNSESECYIYGYGAVAL